MGASTVVAGEVIGASLVGTGELVDVAQEGTVVEEGSVVEAGVMEDVGQLNGEMVDLGIFLNEFPDMSIAGE